MHPNNPALRVGVHAFFYNKPSSRPSTKSFLLFGHILVLKVSKKSLNLAN